MGPVVVPRLVVLTTVAVATVPLVGTAVIVLTGSTLAALLGDRLMPIPALVPEIKLSIR